MTFKKKILKTKIISKSQSNLVMMKFYDGKFTRQQILKEASKLSNEFKNKNVKGKIQIQLNYGTKAPIRYESNKFTSFGKLIKLFRLIDYNKEINYDEPEYFENFNIYLIK